MRRSSAAGVTGVEVTMRTRLLLALLGIAGTAHAVAPQCTMSSNVKSCYVPNMPLFDQTNPNFATVPKGATGGPPQTPPTCVYNGQVYTDTYINSLLPDGPMTGDPGAIPCMGFVDVLCGPTSAAMTHSAAIAGRSPTTVLRGWTASTYYPGTAPLTSLQFTPVAPGAGGNPRPVMSLGDVNRVAQMTWLRGTGGGAASSLQASDFVTLVNPPSWINTSTVPVTLTNPPPGVTASAVQQLIERGGGWLSYSPFPGLPPSEVQIQVAPAATAIHWNSPSAPPPDSQGLTGLVDEGYSLVIALEQSSVLVTPTATGDQLSFSGQTNGHIMAVNGYVQVNPNTVYLSINDPWFAVREYITLPGITDGTYTQNGSTRQVSTGAPSGALGVWSQGAQTVSPWQFNNNDTVDLVYYYDGLAVN
jgi:hypothetical protein